MIADAEEKELITPGQVGTLFIKIKRNIPGFGIESETCNRLAKVSAFKYCGLGEMSKLETIYSIHVGYNCRYNLPSGEHHFAGFCFLMIIISYAFEGPSYAW